MNIIDKFYKSYGLDKPKNKKELSKEIIYKISQKPPPERGANMPKFQTFEDGWFQQADILYLPPDQGFNYLLVVVDNASKRFDAEPVKQLNAKTIVEAFKKIYKRTYVKMPKQRIELDSGVEFNNKLVQDYFSKNNVEIRYAKAQRSRQQAIVERKNFSIAKMLFFRMTAQELLHAEYSKNDKKRDITSREWVNELPDVVKMLNKKIGKFKKPDMETLQELPIKGDKMNHQLLEEGQKVRVKLDKPQEVTGVKYSGRFRATDIKYKPEIRIIKHIILKPGFPPLYLLNDTKGKDEYERGVSYTKQQLQLVDDNERLPPAYVQRRYVVDKIVDKKKIGNIIHYLVKWRGYPDSENTWEKATKLKDDGFEEEIKRFNAQLR
jgi:hypothetical protein